MAASVLLFVSGTKIIKTFQICKRFLSILSPEMLLLQIEVIRDLLSDMLQAVMTVDAF